VVIPGAPLSIKVTGLLLVAIGLARLRTPRRAAEWLRSHRERLTEALDPSAAEADLPRVPLDELLDPVPADGAPDSQPGPVPRDDAAGGPADSADRVPPDSVPADPVPERSEGLPAVDPGG
jgi:hypothetical protein